MTGASTNPKKLTLKRLDCMIDCVKVQPLLDHQLDFILQPILFSQTYYFRTCLEGVGGSVFSQTVWKLEYILEAYLTILLLQKLP